MNMMLQLYVDIYINGYPTSIFIDACSNANLISRKFLNKFVKIIKLLATIKVPLSKRWLMI